MVYFDNTSETQRVFIPRTNIEASAYHPSSGGTERYYAGNNIEITPANIINVTGLTEYIQNTVSGMTLDYATTGDVETMISAATSDFVTSGDVETQITSATQNLVTSGDVETMISGFTTTGDVETMISSATSGMASTQDVQNAVSGLASTQYVDNAVSGKADTSAVTQALSSYTPTANFATINGSGITSGGNIVIEGGGDATTLEEITTLPSEPVNGAMYNYNGRVIRYINGQGDWGKWIGTGVTGSYEYKNVRGNSATLVYAVFPSSMDGALLCSAKYFSTTYVYFFLDLQNDCVKCCSDAAGQTVIGTSYHNGNSYEASVGSYKLKCVWNGNKIAFIQSTTSDYAVYAVVATPCQVSASTAHYELVGEQTGVFETTNNQYGTTVFVGKDGNIEGKGYEIQTTNTRVNSSYRNYLLKRGDSGFPSQMIVPETTGATGSLCVASGGYVAPVWKTIAQALGVDFWTGTQTAYDDMASHSPTTLYIIIPNNS